MNPHDYIFQPDLLAPPRFPRAGIPIPRCLRRERNRSLRALPGRPPDMPHGCRARQHLRLRARRRTRAGHARRPTANSAPFSNICRHRGSELCTGRASGNVIKLPVSWLDLHARRPPAWRTGVRGRRRLGSQSRYACRQFRPKPGDPTPSSAMDPAAPSLAEVIGAISRARSRRSAALSTAGTRLPPRLRDRVQLEGLRRQLPGGLPPARRASRASSANWTTRATAWIHSAITRRRSRRSAPRSAMASRAATHFARRCAAGALLLGSFRTSCSTSIRTT